MARKCKYQIKSRKTGYVVTKSGRVIMRARDRADAETMLRGWLRIDVFPEVWKRCGMLYA